MANASGTSRRRLRCCANAPMLGMRAISRRVAKPDTTNSNGIRHGVSSAIGTISDGNVSGHFTTHGHGANTIATW